MEEGDRVALNAFILFDDSEAAAIERTRQLDTLRGHTYMTSALLLLLLLLSTFYQRAVLRAPLINGSHGHSPRRRGRWGAGNFCENK